MSTYYNPYYYPNYQRPEISYFSGENVDGWLYELECFFYRYQTTVEQKLAIATSYLAGDALEWYRQWCWDMRLSWRIGTWDDFAADLRCRFWSEPLTRPSVILESMSKTCDGIIQLLTEMKNENSIYMSDLSKLKSQLSSISTCGSSANKVEESDLNCELSAADVVSTDCEKFESASAEIELALIDVTEMTTGNILVSKVDEAVESGDDDYDLDVHLHFDLNIDDVVDFTQPEVTPNHLSPDNHIVTVIKTDEYADLKEEIRSETSLGDLISSFSFCTLPVCENASVYLSSFSLAHETFNGNWCSIPLFYMAAVGPNPPWEPPDDRTQRKFKFMSVLMSKNDEIKIINEEDLCIGWEKAEAKQGGFGSYLLGLNKRMYEAAGVNTEGNVPRSYKEPAFGWMTGFLFVTAVVGLLALVPLRKIMIIDYKLTYPSGTATAVLINGFHTGKGDKMTKKKVKGFVRFFSMSFLWSFFQWFFSGAQSTCGFSLFPTFGLKAFKQTFYFDFSMTYVEDEMKNASIVDGDDSAGVDFDLDIYSDLVLSKPSDVPEEEVSFSHMRNDFSSQSVLNENEVVGWKEIQGLAKSVRVPSCSICKCSLGVCQNVSMDCSSYFTLHTGSINYIPAPILKVRSAKPPAKPPEIIHSLHVDDLRALVVNMNDYYEEESSLLSFSDFWKCKRGVHKFVQVMAVDGSFVYVKGKGHKYNTNNDLKIYEHLVQDIGELKFCVFPHMLYILFGFKDVILKLAWLGKPPPLPPEICHNGSAHIGNDVSISEEKASRRIFEVRSNPNFLDGLETYSHLLVLYISREMLHKNQILKVIRENLSKKCIKMFLEIAQNKRGYFKYCETFSMNLKLGVHEDNWNKTKLAGLLVHYSTKSGDEMKNLKLRRQMAQFNDVTDNFGLFFPSPELMDLIKVDLYVDVVKHWELAIVAFTIRSCVTGSLLLLMLLNTGSSLAPQLYHLVGAVSNPKKLVAAITDGSKVPNNIGIVHSLLMRVDNMGDEYVVFQFETAFFILGFSLVDPTFQVCCCVNKFYIFSSPRPPEVADLEDKVNFKEGGMLRNGISRNLRELLVF